MDSKQSRKSGKFQLANEATDCFFSVLLGHSLIFNIAQLVSPSMALPAELVFISILKTFFGGGI